jgi:uncharacterized protein YeaO (DUF488 family)
MPENEPMTLHTKCILTAPHLGDGRRISVMSRHTLNDGRTPDYRLTNQFDEYRPELGPSPRLIGDYYKRNLPWGDFEDRYKDYLSGHLQRESMYTILLLLQTMSVTLLCIEETPEKCHRKLLAEALHHMDTRVRLDIA